MEKYAITISRQFAAMGRSIAIELAKQLGIEFLDRDIVEETAKRMGVTIQEISKEEEEVGSKFAYKMYPLGIGSTSIKDEIFSVQKNIIQDFAKDESCIIVGRCGSYCLKDHPRLLRVYVYAPYEARLKNCVEIFGMSEKEASKAIDRIDIVRENYHKAYIEGYVNPMLESDLCINSASYTIEGAAKLIKDVALMRFA
jgi:cytidylate kinase